MNFSLLWMPDILRGSGLEVEETPGWTNRGHGDEGKPLGVMVHHTCGPLHGDLPDMSVLVNGRPDLGGPLCNLALGRSGKFYAIAAGKGWHAGRGAWRGIEDGNAHFIGIEAENTGETKGPNADPWPDVQVECYVRCVAALLKYIGADVGMCVAHKEFALPKGRKDDPSFDMDKFRKRVAVIMKAPSPPPLPKPLASPKPATLPGVAAKPVAAKPAPAFPRKGTVAAASLNVRQGAGIAHKVVRYLHKGAGVTAIGSVVKGSTTWYEIAGGGFVSGRYVEF